MKDIEVLTKSLGYVALVDAISDMEKTAKKNGFAIHETMKDVPSTQTERKTLLTLALYVKECANV